MSRGLWPLIVGFGIWALAFNALYAAQYLGCYWGWPEQLHRLVLIGLDLIVLSVLVVALLLQRKKRSGPLARTGSILTFLALLASIVVFAPSAFLTICV